MSTPLPRQACTAAQLPGKVSSLKFRTLPGASPCAGTSTRTSSTSTSTPHQTRSRPINGARTPSTARTTTHTAAALVAAMVAFSATVLPAQAAPGTNDPGGNGHGNKNPGSTSALHSLRAPVTDENFYFVMADRFSNGSTTNDDGGLGRDPMVSGFDPTQKGFYNGGD